MKMNNKVLANMVTASFGFKDINDNSTEIGQEQLINAIPKLQVLQPLLIVQPVLRWNVPVFDAPVQSHSVPCVCFVNNNNNNVIITTRSIFVTLFDTIVIQIIMFVL